MNTQATYFAERIETLRQTAETGEQWAEICRLEAEMNGGPFYPNAEDRYSKIKSALRQGYPELAAAIDREQTCRDCGGYVSDDGISVDLNKCCFFCSPE